MSLFSHCAVFSNSDCKTIEEKIQTVESQTAGEIVFAVSKRSIPLWFSVSFFGVFGWGFGFLLYLIFHETSTWGLSPFAWFAFQSLGLGFGMLAGLAPRLVRSMIPVGLQGRFVRARAVRHFRRLGLTKTAAKSGVLVMISELEHQVEILADTGINAKVTQEFWNKGASFIAMGIRNSAGTPAVLHFLTDVQRVLSEHFPPPTHNPNELSNTVSRD